MKGILDRFENDLAVILVEEEKEQFVVPKSDLPEGSKVHTYFTVEKGIGGYKIIGIDTETTTQAAKKTSRLMEQLKAKKKTSKFKKN